MKIRGFNIFYCLLILAFTSCEKYMENFSDCQEIETELHFSTLNAWDDKSDTKTVDGIVEGTTIHDFWLFQFDERGLMVGTMKYYLLEEDAKTVKVTIRKDEGMRYFIIANTYSDSFYAYLGDVSTLERFKSVCKTINGQNDLYVRTGAGQGNLMLNGEAVFEGETFKCVLFRNVAKLVLEIKNSQGSGVKLLTAQIKNIPKVMYYADQLNESDGALFPHASNTDFGEFDSVVLGDGGNGLDSGQESSLQFFLPRNIRGTVVVPDENNKNNSAPEYSTYVEIIGVNNDMEPVRYRFYLGTELDGDKFAFNVQPNTCHKLTLNFSSQGTESDSRVENLGQMNLEESNSYIINPFSRFASRTYSVPITRINTFWAVDSPYVSNHQIGNVTYSGENVLTSDTEWEVVIIWSDKDGQIIKFVNGDGVIAAADGKSCTGKGIVPFRFQTTTDAYGQTTNLLLGLRKKGHTEYLWSWHLWVTPYNPDECFTMTWQEGKYSYAVSGGEVHRYADGESSGLWSGIYNGKFIMDRNLGAGSAESADGYETFGLYYQYGRKDPFMMDKTHRTTSGPSTYVFQTVYSPNVYYANNEIKEIHDWVHDTDKPLTNGKIWNDNSLSSGSTGKSIFDPCPPGWQIPKKGTFDILGTTTPNVSEDEKKGSNRAYGYNMYISAVGEGDTAFFPFTGYLTRAAGSITRNHTATFTGYIFGFCWFDTQFSTTNANMYRYRYSFDNTGVESKNLYVDKNTANPIRCIRSNE